MRILSATETETTAAFNRKHNRRIDYVLSPIVLSVYAKIDAEGYIKVILDDRQEAATLYENLTRNSKIRRLGYEFKRNGTVIYGRKEVK